MKVLYCIRNSYHGNKLVLAYYSVKIIRSNYVYMMHIGHILGGSIILNYLYNNLE